MTRFEIPFYPYTPDLQPNIRDLKPDNEVIEKSNGPFRESNVTKMDRWIKWNITAQISPVIHEKYGLKPTDCTIEQQKHYFRCPEI